MAGKNFKQLTTLQKAIYTRIYDEVHNSRSYGVFSPEGKNLGMKTKKDGGESKVAWGSYKQIENAVRAIEDPSYESLSALTGDQHKVRNFYNNILLPNKALEDVTIDTHAVAAALLRPLAGSDTEVTHNLGGGVPASSITGAKGTYGFFADAYREAARQRGMKPREMQSITWEAVRGLFPSEWKQNKKNKVLVDSLWKRYSGGRTKIDVIRKEILKSAGGINNPEWFGFDSRGAKGGGSRGDTKKLDGPGVSRGAAKTGGYGGRGYPGDPRVPTTGKIPVFLEEKTQPKEIRFAFMPADQDYLAAVDKGDTGGAQAMVDQAAKAAGYKGPWYHGSDGSFSSFKAGSMFTKDSSYAKDHGSTVKRFYLRGVDNPIPLSLGEFQGLGGAKGISRLSGTYQLGDSLIVNDPSQVKSAEPVTRDDDGNVIPLSERFNPGEDDFNYMPATDEMGFYSRVAQVAESNKISKGPGNQILATIKKQPGVRDDEIKWLGLEEFLKGKKQVTKEELTDFIRENNLQMEETVLGTDSGDLGKKIPVEEIRLVQRKDPIGGKETWYRESSDGSYREDVTQPIDRWLEEGVIKSVEDYDQWWIDNSKEQGEDFVTVDEYTETSTGDRTKYESETLPGAEPGSYKEVLLKMPVSDRKMTLEEMIATPDYGQFIIDYFNGNDSPARQKKIHKSYLAGEPFKTRDYGPVDLNFNSRDEPNYKSSHWDEPNVLAHIRFNVRKGPNGERILFIEELQSDWHREGREGGYGGVIPDAPFKTSWHELALKRVLRFAAEGNFDKLAWINGEETAKRYDLSKKVSEVVYDEATQSLNAYSKTGIVFMEKGVPPEKIAEYIGKEPAERLLNQPYDHPLAEMSYEQDKYGGFGYVKKPGSKTSKRLKGEELKVGGEWAHNLYDKMVPQFLKKYGKKWGAKVEDVEIGLRDPGELKSIDNKPANFDSINITAEMKESVEAGQAMYMPATEADSRIPSRVPAKPVVSNRSPMLQWLAQSFIEKGLIDKEDWDTAVNALSPIDAKRSQIPDAFKVGQVNQNYPMVLDSVKQEKFVDVLLGEGPKEGTSVGLRIDIKAFENSLAKVASGELDFPVYVVAIHSEGSAKSIGKDIEGYSAIAAVSNPSFLIGSEKGSLAIAAGKPKTTLATVEGEWMPLSEVPNVTGEGWTRVGMDPTRHSYFYDKVSGQPIKGGSLAISFGNTVFVRDAIPMTPEEASGVLYMPAKEVGGSTVYKGEEGARVIKTKSGKFRVYGANKALLGIASSQKMADRILQRGTKKVSIRKRPSRGLAGVGGS
jgi:hypothetical protein